MVAVAARPFPTMGSSLPLQARRQFQSQLADLQQLPDILKITEAKLAECQDQLQGYERKNIDLTAIISDLRSRVRGLAERVPRTGPSRGPLTKMSCTCAHPPPPREDHFFFLAAAF